jgi:hypothetical protein
LVLSERVDSIGLQLACEVCNACTFGDDPLSQSSPWLRELSELATFGVLVALLNGGYGTIQVLQSNVNLCCGLQERRSEAH